MVWAEAARDSVAKENVKLRLASNAVRFMKELLEVGMWCNKLF